jgi:hypothetical protein
MKFVDAVHRAELDRRLSAGPAILHYAGHCDVVEGRGCLFRESEARDDLLRLYSSDLARRLRAGGTKLAAFAACNSGRWPVVQPVLAAGVPAVVAVHTLVSTHSASHFFEALYAALSVGLSIDEAVTFGRQKVLHAAPLGHPCEWGAFMVYCPTREAVLFPRPGTRNVKAHQGRLRRERSAEVSAVRSMIAGLGDGAEAGAFITEFARRSVLILGRFGDRRKPVLQAVSDRLKRAGGGEGGYQPILFDFDRPPDRDLTESVLGLAGLSRFIVADLTEPRGVPAELQQIVPNLPSVPVKPLLQAGHEPYANFENIARRDGVLPPFVYRDIGHLMARFETSVIRPAEKQVARVRAKYARTRRQLQALRRAARTKSERARVP